MCAQHLSVSTHQLGSRMSRATLNTGARVKPQSRGSWSVWTWDLMGSSTLKWTSPEGEQYISMSFFPWTWRQWIWQGQEHALRQHMLFPCFKRQRALLMIHADCSESLLWLDIATLEAHTMCPLVGLLEAPANLATRQGMSCFAILRSQQSILHCPVRYPSLSQQA